MILQRAAQIIRKNEIQRFLVRRTFHATAQSLDALDPVDTFSRRHRKLFCSDAFLGYLEDVVLMFVIYL